MLSRPCARAARHGASRLGRIRRRHIIIDSGASLSHGSVAQWATLPRDRNSTIRIRAASRADIRPSDAAAHPRKPAPFIELVGRDASRAAA